MFELRARAKQNELTLLELELKVFISEPNFDLSNFWITEVRTDLVVTPLTEKIKSCCFTYFVLILIFMIQMSAILPNLFRHYQTFIVIHQRTIHCSTSCQFKAEPIITEKQQQHDRDLIAESLPQQAEHPQSPPQPIGGSCWWKKP
jgi:hypothetical protein